MRTIPVFLVVLLAALSPTAVAQQKVTVRAPGAAAGLPFSSAVRVGDMLYLSGEVGRVPGTTTLVAGGIVAETRQTLENIKAVLEYAGSSLRNVVKCTVFLADIAEYQSMNAVYREYFSVDPPARSTVAGSGLALGARVEIECTAVVP